MRPVGFLFVALLASVLGSARAQTMDSGEQSRILAEAERIRSSDKPKSRAMLDAVNRTITPATDPLIRGQALFLECLWAEEPPVAYRFFAAGMALAEQTKSTLLKSRLYVCRANALQFEGKSREAEADYTAAAAFAAQARNGAAEADARASLAFLEYNRGAMADALSNLQTAYRISASIGDEKGRLDALTLMANVYADSKVAQYDRAIEYYRQLLAGYRKLGLPSDVADTLYNIASTFESKGNQAAAEFHYRRALAEFEALKSESDIIYTRRALASSLMKQGRVKEALPHFDAALAFYENKKDAGSVAFVRQFRGSAYRRLGRFDAALRELDAARVYSENEKNTRYLERNVEETALVYEQLGDWRNAWAFRKRYEALHDELAVSRRDELASRLRIEFDAEKKERENRALSRENALRAAALREAERNQELQFAVIILTALLAVALALLFWRQAVNTRRMRAMAMTDDLTRLPNRRHILAAVEMALAEAQRNGHPVALIMLDIDRFKRINDTHGHAAGDEILKRVARTCRLTLRTPDQIGRIGGEEFLIVLRGATTPQQAGEVAERLRAAVEQLDLSSIAADLQVTISLGVCVTSEHDAKTAIAAADELLYRAKENGRNRVEMSVEEEVA
jgi:diguanylate cyclase (GGDEF)-like protein